MSDHDTSRALRRFRVFFAVMSIGAIAAGIAIARLAPGTFATVFASALVACNLAFNGIYLYRVTNALRARPEADAAR